MVLRVAGILVFVLAVGLVAVILGPASETQNIGLRHDQRPAVVILISIVQLGLSVIASTTLLAWARGEAAIPRPMRGRREPDAMASPVDEVTRGWRLRSRIRLGIGLTIYGSMLVLLTVPLTTILLVWLIRGLLQPLEAVAVVAYVGLTLAWVVHIIRQTSARA